MQIFLGRDIPMHFRRFEHNASDNPLMQDFLSHKVEKHIDWIEWCKERGEDWQIHYAQSRQEYTYNYGYVIRFFKGEEMKVSKWIENIPSSSTATWYDLFLSFKDENNALQFKLIFGDWRFRFASHILNFESSVLGGINASKIY